MPGLTGLVHWIQAGINCSHSPIFVQIPDVQPSPLPTSDPIVGEDITMRESSPACEDSDDAWSQLIAFAQDLVTKDPRTLTPQEAALLRILNLRYGVQREEMNRSRVKRSGSLVDQVMQSPPPVHQTLPPEQPSSIPDSDLQDCSREAEETNIRGEPDVLTDYSAFINVRHHPYAHAGGSPRADEVPKWVKKKASRRTMVERETRQFKKASVKETELHDSNPDCPRVQAKKLELLSQARARAEAAGEMWDETAFLGQYANYLQETAERLVREEEDANHRRSVHDGYFAKAVEYIDTICKRQLDEQTRIEETVLEKLKAIVELDGAIDRLRMELKRLRNERRRYPENREALNEELRMIASAKDHAARQHEELLLALQSAMEQNEQDFFAGWRAFQVHLGMAEDSWPPGVPQPETGSPTSTEDSSDSSYPFASTPFVDANASSPSDASDGSPSPTPTRPVPIPPPSPTSPSATSSTATPPTSSAPFCYQFLPVRQPRTNEERIVRYAEGWALLKSGRLVDGNATFDQMPWPVFFKVNRDCLDELTLESIREFIFHPSRLGEKPPQKVLNDELLRWHQDKLTAILRKFAPEDRPAILAAGNRIATFLVQLRDLL